MASGRRSRARIVIPIIAAAGILVLAGAGFLTYWLIAGQGGSSSHATNSAGSPISAAVYHTCAVLSGGTVECWGYNENGELGNGTTTKSSAPVQVSGITNATQVSVGGDTSSANHSSDHSCALLSGGTVECWGYNQDGELGNGTTTNSSTPVQVSGITNATQVSTGDYHTCAVLSDGTAKCWGDNTWGELGNGTTTKSPTPTPVQVSGITNASSIAAGEFHSCAVLSDGTAKCWGDNTFGGLGNGTTTKSATPVAVSGIANASSISAGVFHTCAVLSDGTVKCWGYNTWGALGNGTTTKSPTPTPVQVSGITNASSIAAGQYHSCALLRDGTAQCWGGNTWDELGDGTTNDSSTPVSVVGLP